MPTAHKYHKLSRKTVLSPDFITIWESISLGVIVIDESGNCVYINALQRNMDGFGNRIVLGEHISKFYTPHTFATLPILQCLGTGTPILKKSYWYKTTTNKLINSVNDLVPLFENGRIDGAIAFSSIYGLSAMAQKSEPSRKASNPREGHDSVALHSFDSIIGSAPLLKKGMDTAQAAARTSSHVMIWGESGTGKELFAQAIHTEGVRKNKPFIPVNCSAIPENLLEGLMFGTVKGAFTDAVDRPGLFENADGGTLLLDEINSMPLGLQAKLLRAVQENTIRRVGSQKEIPIDVRIISILNEHPLKALEKGTLRSDLYYRLAVVGISVPPLRERKEDILYLADYFLCTSQLNPSGSPVRLSDKVCSMFVNYIWPGNIRELQNVIEGSLAILDGGALIYPEHLSQQLLESYAAQKSGKTGPPPAPPPHNAVTPYQKAKPPYYDYTDVETALSPMPLKSHMMEYEKSCIKNVLKFTGGNVAKAARILQMKPAALHYRIHLLGLDR